MHVTIRRFDLAVAALLLAGALLALAPGIHGVPYGYADEGYHDYIAWRIAAGDAPYRDIDLETYVPGQFYLLSWLWRVATDPIAATRWAWALLLAGNAVLIYAVGAAWRVRAAALAVAAALVLVPGPWAKGFLPTLNVLLLLAALAAVRPRPHEGAFAALGALVGAGLWLRGDFAFVAAAATLACLAASRARPRGGATGRHAAAAAAGFVVLMIPLLALLARDGALTGFGDQLRGFLTVAAGRSTAWYRLPRPPLAAVMQSSTTGTLARFLYGSLAVPAAIGGLIVRDALRQRGRRAWPTRLVWHLVVLAWLAGSLPQYLVERPDIAHLGQRSFAPLVAGLWVMASLRAGTARRAAGAAGALALAAFVTAYAGHWMVGSPLFMSPPAEAHTLANGVAFLANPPDYGELLDRVLAESPAGAPVASLPFGPGFNVLLRRRLPGRQVLLLPHSLDEPGAEQEAIADLVDGAVPFVLVTPEMEFNGRSDTRLAHFAPRLWRTLTARYEVVDDRGWIVLYRLRGGPGGVSEVPASEAPDLRLPADRGR